MDAEELAESMRGAEQDRHHRAAHKHRQKPCLEKRSTSSANASWRTDMELLKSDALDKSLS